MKCYLSDCLEISASQGFPYSSSDHTSQIGISSSECRAIFRPVYHYIDCSDTGSTPRFCFRPAALLDLCSTNYKSLYGLPCHFYADDTKSFIAVKANQRDLENVVNRIEDCLLEVMEWMDANFLKPNNEKTELVLFGSRQQPGKVALNGLNVCDIIVRSQDVAKDIGVFWDSQMMMISQIANVCKTFILHLRNIIKN